MSIPTIIQRENPTLRLKAKEVDLSLLDTKEFKKVLTSMKKALHAQKDGVAIAAPQIDVSLRIFIIAGKVFNMIQGDFEEGMEATFPDLICINPEITKLSKTKKEMEEGCLSVRWKYGKIKRSTKATLTAYNEKGEKFTRGGSGLLAQIFQHETDHLNGILFIDNAKEIVDLPPEKHV
jgi:peptide deformylase